MIGTRKEDRKKIGNRAKLVKKEADWRIQKIRSEPGNKMISERESKRSRMGNGHPSSRAWIALLGQWTLLRKAVNCVRVWNFYICIQQSAEAVRRAIEQITFSLHQRTGAFENISRIPWGIFFLVPAHASQT